MISTISFRIRRSEPENVVCTCGISHCHSAWRGDKEGVCTANVIKVAKMRLDGLSIGTIRETFDDKAAGDDPEIDFQSNDIKSFLSVGSERP
jgi:hypothetical protein